MELKEVTEFLGIEAKDLTELKSKFSAKFISKKEAAEDDEIIQPVVSKITGKFAGTINTLAKKYGKLTNEDLEGKKYEEVIELLANKKDAEIAALKDLQGKGSDEKVKEWETKFEKLNTTLAEEKEAKELLKKTLEDKEADWSGKFKGIKINTILSAAKEKIAPKLIDMSEEQKFFLENRIKESYKIDFDEKENTIVLGLDGKRIPNPNKAGDFLGLEEAILKIAEEKNYVKKNPGGVVTPTFFQEVKQEVKTTDTTRKVHPNAVKQAESLKQAVGQ